MSKYEDVFYDSKSIHDNHIRILRSLDSDLFLSFHNFKRNFNMKLSPARSLFEHDYIEIENQKFSTKEFYFYEGKLVDEPNSKVSGSIIDGVFYGTIKTTDGIFQIESSKRYNQTFTSHSIIYHEKDLLLHEYLKKRDLFKVNHGGCASETVMKWMRKTQEDAYKENFQVC